MAHSVKLGRDPHRFDRYASIGQRLLVGIASIAIGLVSSEASAQLRSGRTTRALYSEAVAAPNQQTKKSPVRTVSHTVELDSTSTKHSTDSSVVSASCTQCEAQQGILHEPALVYDFPSGPQSFSSPDCGCDTCSGGRARLAPTCMAVCPPGCGPLMALWCRMSVRAEVPLYWRRAAGPPALVTTSDSNVPPALAGLLGQATTSTLLGDGPLNEDATAGFRLSLSTWLGSGQQLGLAIRYWNAGDLDDTFAFSSTNFPVLARPFLDTSAATPAQNTQLISYPGESVGNIRVSTTSSVDGLELSLRRLLYLDRFTRVDWLWGYQHVTIDEGLTIASSTTVTGTVPALTGSSIAVTDRFNTENDFNGMSYGILSTRSFACWKMETLFRLGAGNLRRKVNISGTTVTASAVGATSTEAQGLLARNTNNLPYVDDTFVVVPEIGINFACMLRPGLDFNVGYNYLMIPKVAQASRQIDKDLAVNLSDPIAGSLDPQLDFEEREYWLHSLGLGLQLRY
ncbi:MAG: BBP7 family outer membrane beta-barrel protein [Planctomycetales bacterium]|nr:BBP7 family outer membrane beta-barrel protein [Planctomycetales bacterium]